MTAAGEAECRSCQVMPVHAGEEYHPPTDNVSARAETTFSQQCSSSLFRW
jgi:hypothetical protein